VDFVYHPYSFDFILNHTFAHNMIANCKWIEGVFTRIVKVMLALWKL